MDDNVQFELHETRVGDARLAYVDEGAGENVLLLHGYPQNHRCWRYHIGPLAEKHRVVAPDWFGWGQSERSLACIPEFHAEVELLGRTLETLNLDDFNFIAHDYGGLLALGYMIRWPERVRRLAILNSRAHGTFSPAFYRQVALQGFAARSRFLRPLLHRIPVGNMHRRGLARYVKKGCFDAEQLEDYIRWMDEPFGKKWLAHFYRYYELPPRQDLVNSLPDINCPTSVIWGDRDAFIPFDIAEQLAERIPHAVLERIEGGDHYIMEERPDDVLEAIHRLLAREPAIATST